MEYVTATCIDCGLGQKVVPVLKKDSYICVVCRQKKYAYVMTDKETGKFLWQSPPMSKEDAVKAFENFNITNTHLFSKKIIEINEEEAN
jgi:hypothetical protein